MQVNHELQVRVKQDELGDLESRLLDKLNELLASIDARYADKELTRKKITMLEKNVSVSVTIMTVIVLQIKNLFDHLLKTEDP